MRRLILTMAIVVLAGFVSHARADDEISPAGTWKWEFGAQKQEMTLKLKFEKGKLTGLLIDAPSFPGWDSFGALIEHLRFVHNRHRNIDRVAAVTDSTFLKIAPKIAQHFAHPEIKRFAGGEKEKALEWLKGGA